MNLRRRRACPLAPGLIAIGLVIATLLSFAVAQRRTPELPSGFQPQGKWASDPTWYDGLVEKATYDAEMVIYGRQRKFEAVFLTNKEQHDAATWTKDADGKGQLVEVWKHNQVEVVPTPNYEYKFVTTAHLRTDDLSLTRLDASSQEWCGASFKQYQRNPAGGWDYTGFSYLPEQGRRGGTVARDADLPVVPFNALPLWLRGYEFEKGAPMRLMMIPDQKHNGISAPEPYPVMVSLRDKTEEGYVVELGEDPRGPNGEEGEPRRIGMFTFARDRNHVMLTYEGADGQKYRLKELERVNYWTRDEE